mmetsp:Transcript_166642/g.529541  ORF Transcript_166642/g.529541 Transcript_166642/m.529541 type:complete len:247 (+) Transcript_166642:319-1059(+)
MPCKVGDMLVRAAQVREERRLCCEVVRRVVREDQEVRPCGLLQPPAEQVEGLPGPLLRDAQASMAAAGPLAVIEVQLVERQISIPALHELVEVQADDFEVQLRMVLVPIRAWHEQGVEGRRVGIDLCALAFVVRAAARILVVVVISIDAIPRHGSQLLRVDISPLDILTLDSVRVEGVSDIDDKLDISKPVHRAEHLLGDGLLALDAVHVAVRARVPAPISDDQKGAQPRQPRRGPGNEQEGADYY